MRKIVIIPSKTPQVPKTLLNFYTEGGWEVHVMDGCSSIFEAFSKGVEKAKVKPEDYVIMCHDDIHILTNPTDFNTIIDKLLQKNKIGFLGVAGTRILKESCVWWEGMNLHPAGHLAGNVYHGTTFTDMRSTYYGPEGEVVAMDGVFLACTGRTIKQIKLSKPKKFKGDWDFYDVYYTVQAHLKGLKNYVIPIQIFHRSLGEINGKDSWHKNREALSEMLEDKLPIFIK